MKLAVEGSGGQTVCLCPPIPSFTQFSAPVQTGAISRRWEIRSLSDLFRVREGEVNTNPYGPTPFPILLSSLCHDITSTLGGQTSILFLYDELADGFTAAAVCGARLAELEGESLAASDARGLVQALLDGEALAFDGVDGSPVRGDSPVARALAGRSVMLLPLDDGTPIGVLALLTGDAALGVTPDRAIEACREAARTIAAARPERAHDCLFRRVLEIDPGGVAIVEGERYIFSYASSMFRQAHNLLDEPILGRALGRVVPSPQADRLVTLLDEVRDRGEPHHAGGVEIVDDYGSRYYDVHLLPERDARGDVVAILIILWSRTDAYVTRRALQSTIVKLAESESLLAAVLNASNSGIAFISTEGVVAYANRRIAEFFGVQTDDLVGHAMRDIVDRYFASRVRDPQAMIEHRYRLDGDMHQIVTDEVEVVRPTHRILERYSAPVHAEDSDVLGRVEVYTDVTEVRQLQRNKDEFLSLVSHELRTPVTSIKGYAQLLQRRARKEQTSEPTLLAYETIERQTTKMQALIDMLLDLTRLESGRLRLEIRPLDIRDLVGRVAQMVQMTSENHTIALHLPARPLWLEGDEHRLEQVLLNLLTNAVRYSPDRSTVTVSIAEQGERVHIAVRDEGIGIAPDSLTRIFERFYRAEGVPESSGLGVGLYIAKGIVDRHGGEMRVESELGAGSTFTVVLPMHFDPQLGAEQGD